MKSAGAEGFRRWSSTDAPGISGRTGYECVLGTGIGRRGCLPAGAGPGAVRAAPPLGTPAFGADSGSGDRAISGSGGRADSGSGNGSDHGSGSGPAGGCRAGRRAGGGPSGSGDPRPTRGGRRRKPDPGGRRVGYARSAQVRAGRIARRPDGGALSDPAATIDDVAVTVALPFVGRAEQLDRFGAALAAARAGEPSVILLSGDAGVGKTRLLTRMAELAGRTALGGRSATASTSARSACRTCPFTEALAPAARPAADDGRHRPSPPGRRWAGCSTAGCPSRTAGPPRTRPPGCNCSTASPPCIGAGGTRRAPAGADDRGPALGGPVEPGRPAVPARAAAVRAPAGGRHLPDRRPAPPPPPAAGAGRAAAAPARSTTSNCRRSPGTSWREFGAADHRAGAAGDRLLQRRADAGRRATPTSPRSCSRPARTPPRCPGRWPTSCTPGWNGWTRRSRCSPASRPSAGRRVSERAVVRRWPAANRSSPTPDRSTRRCGRRSRTTCWRRGWRWIAFRHALLAEAVYADLLPGESAGLHRAYLRRLAADPALGSPAELAHHALRAHELPVALAASVRRGAGGRRRARADGGAAPPGDGAVGCGMPCRTPPSDSGRTSIDVQMAAAGRGQPGRAARRGPRRWPVAALDRSRRGPGRPAHPGGRVLPDRRPARAGGVDAGRARPGRPGRAGPVRRPGPAAGRARPVRPELRPRRRGPGDRGAGGAEAQELGVPEAEADALTTLGGAGRQRGRPAPASCSAGRWTLARSVGDLTAELRATHNLAEQPVLRRRAARGGGDLRRRASNAPGRPECCGSGYGVGLLLYRELIRYMTGRSEPAGADPRLGARIRHATTLSAIDLYAAVARGDADVARPGPRRDASTGSATR